MPQGQVFASAPSIFGIPCPRTPRDHAAHETSRPDSYSGCAVRRRQNTQPASKSAGSRGSTMADCDIAASNANAHDDVLVFWLANDDRCAFDELIVRRVPFALRALGSRGLRRCAHASPRRLRHLPRPRRQGLGPTRRSNPPAPVNYPRKGR